MASAGEAGPKAVSTLGSASLVTEMLSMPASTRKRANSGWSLGACPHRPTWHLAKDRIPYVDFVLDTPEYDVPEPF